MKRLAPKRLALTAVSLGAVTLLASGCGGVASIPLPGGADVGSNPCTSTSSSPMCWIWCRSPR